MNEITVHGNITATPVLRHSQNGDGNAFLTFAVAVNRRYYSSAKGGWVDLPTVFHQVLARYELAEHAAVSLAKGTTVTVTGYFTDNSYVPAGAEQTVRQLRIEASDIAVSLRFATAVVTKRPRGEAPGSGAETHTTAAPVAEPAV